MKNFFLCFIFIISLNHIFAENDKLMKISWIERKVGTRNLQM